MKSFVAGTLLGAALGAAAMFMWMNSGDKPSAETVAWEKPDTTIESDPHTPSTQQSRAKRNPFDIAETQPTAPSSQTAQPGAETDSTVPAGALAALTHSAAKAPTESQIVIEPIPTSAAHRKIIDADDSFVKAHAALEAQPRDDNWSYYMEQLLNSYFASRISGTGVTIQNIACRKTHCEVLAISELGTGYFDVLWQRATRETWWDFSNWSGRSSGENENVTIVMFLERSTKNQSRKSDPKTNRENTALKIVQNREG